MAEDTNETVGEREEDAHFVPAELLELFEALEWDKAVKEQNAEDQ